MQTNNYQVKVYFLSKFAESHDISYVKDLRNSTLYKEVYSWFLEKSKFWFFREVSSAKVTTAKSSISVFQEIFASADKIFILVGGLSTTQ